MINVNIRTQRTTGEASLFTYLRIGDKNYAIDLHLMVDVSHWREISASKKKIENFLDKIGYSQRLVQIEFGIKELKRENKYTIDEVKRLVQDIVLKEKREKFLENKRIGKEIREQESKSIKTYIVNFVDQMETGDVRTNRGELYTPQSIKVWKQFRRIFLDFYTSHPFGWNEIDKHLINRFLT